MRFLASLILKLDYSEKNPWGNKKDSDDDDGPSLAVNSKAGLGRAAFFLDTALLYTTILTDCTAEYFCDTDHTSFSGADGHSGNS